MSKIKSSNTKGELLLRTHLWRLGHRYRLKSTLPGKPDIVLHKYRIAIFVDGEFWHGFNWAQKRAKIVSNRDYWIEKIEGNMARDVNNNALLKSINWTVIRFWEHQVIKDIETCLKIVSKAIRKCIKHQ